MIRRFVVKCALLGIPVVALAGLYLFWHRPYLPAPHATNNLALNEKAAAFAGRSGAPQRLLAFGSSMALNNLASDVVTEHFGTAEWFNMGAWGLDMAQTCALAARFTRERGPGTVLITGNLMDFTTGPDRSTVDLDAVVRVSNEGRAPWLYVRHPALVYYLRQAETNRIRYSDRANYECLMMDGNGGVFLDVPRERIIDERWVRSVPPASALADEQYEALEDLAAALERAGVRMVYLGSPYRSGMIGPAERGTISAHERRVRAIVEKHGHRYADASDRDWPDDLYCDSSHLQRAGAVMFTRHVLAKVPV